MCRSFKLSFKSQEALVMGFDENINKLNYFTNLVFGQLSSVFEN
jgi:hypothetical protein